MRTLASILLLMMVIGCDQADGPRAGVRLANAATLAAPGKSATAAASAQPSAAEEPEPPPDASATTASATKAPSAAKAETPSASRYAALTPKACLAALAQRGIPYESAPAAQKHVTTPVRLTGPLNGVEIEGIGLATARKGKRAKKSPYTIADCRLLLALDDLAGLLKERGIVELHHMSMYRPGARKPGKKISQHQRGLAIDVGAFVTKDGEEIVVKDTWKGKLGQPPCPTKTFEGTAGLLHQLPCTLHDERRFHVIVTPNANRQHADHLHLDLTEGADWFVID